MSSIDGKTRNADNGSSKSGSATVVVPRENSHDEPYDVVQKVPNKTWKSYFWDTLDKSPEERRFLFKLDAVVLTFASLGYFIKNLDQINLNNAYVSGMKEDMNMHGNELNYMQTLWTVGYVLGEIPRFELCIAKKEESASANHIQ